MPCCLGNVQIFKNEGTIIFGNIRQYAPSTNTVSTESPEEAEEENQGEGSASVSRRRRETRHSRGRRASAAPPRSKKGPAATGSGPKGIYYKKGGRDLLYAPFINGR
ncbi:hypothetical protein DX130_20550 [Paenibacillus paeoniae]|uniref:Uncharacterized protein n=1 Tax=Paenibacillus paeoniae TaxID=2292705 RepID=A0A371P783_9BACL|nr:hypothetical protein DX130_20550 [Paenibacillus paeoniae]